MSWVKKIEKLTGGGRWGRGGGVGDYSGLESKRNFNVKSSTYYFHIKTKILVDFQFGISVPLRFIIDLRIPLKFDWFFKVFKHENMLFFKYEYGWMKMNV